MLIAANGRRNMLIYSINSFYSSLIIRICSYLYLYLLQNFICFDFQINFVHICNVSKKLAVQELELKQSMLRDALQWVQFFVTIYCKHTSIGDYSVHSDTFYFNREMQSHKEFKYSVDSLCVIRLLELKLNVNQVRLIVWHNLYLVRFKLKIFTWKIIFFHV